MAVISMALRTISLLLLSQETLANGGRKDKSKFQNCAAEGNICRCTGTIQYRQGFRTIGRKKNVKGQIMCTDEAFGKKVKQTKSRKFCRCNGKLGFMCTKTTVLGKGGKADPCKGKSEFKSSCASKSKDKCTNVDCCEEVEYFAEKKKKCERKMDLAACKKATKALGYKFRDTEVDADWPTGCYMNSLNEDKPVYFNTAKADKDQEGAHRICIRTKPQTTTTEAPTTEAPNTEAPTTEAPTGRGDGRAAADATTEAPQPTRCDRGTPCTNIAFPICDLSTRTCKTCSKDRPCLNRNHIKPVCDTNSTSDTFGHCIECRQSAHCKVELTEPICNIQKNTCEACSTNDECRDLSVSLPYYNNQLYCDKSVVRKGRCRACLEDNHCSAADKPICHVEQDKCGKCLYDYECREKDSSKPACDGNATSPTHGHCLVCVDDKHCKDPANPICNTKSNACEPCQSSTECNAKNSTLPICAGGLCQAAPKTCDLNKRCVEQSDCGDGCMCHRGTNFCVKSC